MAIHTHLAPVSNAEDWSITVAVTDDGAGYDLSPYAVEVRVNDERGRKVLGGSTGDGTVVVATDDDLVPSVLSWTFRAAAMAALVPASYLVAVRISDGTNTNQIILGRLPVIDGGFSS